MQQHTMRRELGARQISFMALGMAIGVGLFLGSASMRPRAGRCTSAPGCWCCWR
ncbi:hypothetical protein [Burkholderia anthina]|uniref:hypothetical protein n=1 Tax=Burkholderia anthina TaxID=179879 RepID=UPI00158D17DC|nr:hypothetical protein [Burkholderia anthina]